MTDFASQFWPMLWRTTLTLTLAALASGLVLRPARPRSPLLHRTAWLMTLLVGWSFLRLSVPIAWYEPAARTHAVGGTLPAGMLGPAHSAAEPAGEATKESRLIAWPAVAIAVWGLGIAGLIGTWSIGYVRFIRRLPRQQPAEPEWEAQWRVLLAAAKVQATIPLRVTPDVGPLLCRRTGGYELMIPAELWRVLSAEERAAILRHELAHYQRGDVWKSLAARILMLPHWFNPAAWWAARRFDEAAEWACDQVVLDYAPAPTYAQTLLKLGQQVVTVGSPGMAARGASLAVRIRRLLLSPTAKESSRKQAARVVAICLMAGLALLRVELVAKEPAAQGLGAQQSARLTEAIAKRQGQGESVLPSIVVGPDDEPGGVPAVVPVPYPNTRAAPTAPYRGPTYLPIPTDPNAQYLPIPTDPDAQHLPIPNYSAESRGPEQTWRFRGPRGETFETDGLHLWRIAPFDRAHPWRGALPVTPRFPFVPKIGESTEGENPSKAEVDESSTDETGELLQHDYGKSAGKRSIAGSGHAVRFESPGEDRLLTSVRIYGSRYGFPQAPNEDFHVWLCDEEMHQLAQFDFPYARFERGDPAWVTLKTEPTKVAKNFILCVGFHPEQTKGVYVHYDDMPAKNSLTGLPGQEPKVFSAGNWMIRATVAQPKADRAE